MLNYTYGTNGIAIPKGKDYLVNVWPTSSSRVEDNQLYQQYKEQVKRDIEMVRDKVDVLIVAMHWGVEYTHEPTDYQKDMASYLASLDVDIVFSALNILPNKSGYVFWKDAIFLYLILGKQKLSVCNDIYPLISKKYNATTMSIDRAMRRCFENVLYYAAKNENNFICAYLKNTILYPHNSELIVKIVELISSKKFQQNKLNGF
jgi:hypothetical protein